MPVYSMPHNFRQIAGNAVSENELSELIQQRRKKLQAIVDLGYEAYPRKYPVTHSIPQIVAQYASLSAEQSSAEKTTVRVPGRVMTIRPHGKAGFAHLAGGGKHLQIYVRLDAVGERDFALYKLLDLGDLIGVEGYLFRTRTGELTIHAEHLQFASEGGVTAAGKMAWPHRRGSPLPATLSGLDGE